MTTAQQDRLEAVEATLAALNRTVAALRQDQHVVYTALDTSWLTQCAASILLMQIGFAMLEAGAVREQNAIATYTKNVLDLTTGSLIATFWGYQLAYGTHPLDDSLDSADKMSFFVYLTFQATAATIVSGSMAERTSLFGYLVISCFVSGVLFPLATAWTWGGGFLSSLDPPFQDFAGSGVVHLVGGTTALVGAWAVGPRMHRWDPSCASEFVPHNVPSMLAGMLFLWVGWYGFNPASTRHMSSAHDVEAASNAVATTTIAAAAGGTA